MNFPTMDGRVIDAQGAGADASTRANISEDLLLSIIMPVTPWWKSRYKSVARDCVSIKQVGVAVAAARGRAETEGGGRYRSLKAKSDETELQICSQAFELRHTHTGTPPLQPLPQEHQVDSSPASRPSPQSPKPSAMPCITGMGSPVSPTTAASNSIPTSSKDPIVLNRKKALIAGQDQARNQYAAHAQSFLNAIGPLEEHCVLVSFGYKL